MFSTSRSKKIIDKEALNQILRRVDVSNKIMEEQLMWEKRKRELRDLNSHKKSKRKKIRRSLDDFNSVYRRERQLQRERIRQRKEQLMENLSLSTELLGSIQLKNSRSLKKDKKTKKNKKKRKKKDIDSAKREKCKLETVGSAKFLFYFLNYISKHQCESKQINPSRTGKKSLVGEN
ncbi:uncharacterized protein LOC135121332 [Zophobas morio]|uniref:uncharacterized protein LOC135121332 n=1 Tax=Zophobas morio TaxID=2755281 RepID=UPI0030838804